MAGRKSLRDQQHQTALAIAQAAHALGVQSDPQQARKTRDVVVAKADAAVEIIETLARVEA